jgi:hypothetical protein
MTTSSENRPAERQAIPARWSLLLPLICLLVWAAPRGSMASSAARPAAASPAAVGSVMWTDTVMRVRAFGPCHGRGCWKSVPRATKHAPLHDDNWLHLDKGQTASIKLNGYSGESFLGPQGLDMTVYGYRNTHHRLAGGLFFAPAAFAAKTPPYFVLHRGQILENVPAGKGVSIRVNGAQVSIPAHQGPVQVDVTASGQRATVTVLKGRVTVQRPFVTAQRPLRTVRTISVGAARHVLMTPHNVSYPRSTKARAASALVAWLHRVPPTLQRAIMPLGEVGKRYRQPAVITGTGPYGWSVGNRGDTMPPGLRVDARSGDIAGTPKRAGTYAVFLIVTDSRALQTVRLVTFTILPRLAATPIVPVEGEVGQPYHGILSASGGAASYHWALRSGALPAGVSLNPDDGTLSGTPRRAGTSRATLTVTDGMGVTASVHLTITIARRLVITTSALPAGEAGVSYPPQQLDAAGGAPRYHWTVGRGALPPGLDLSPGGKISGTPTEAGTSTVTVKVKDRYGVIRRRPLAIAIAAHVAVNAPSMPPAEVGVPYHLQLQAALGAPPYAWTGTVTGCGSNGACPGLTVQPDGSIAGQPKAAGTAQIQVTVTDALGGQVSASYTVTISPHVAIVTQGLHPTVAAQEPHATCPVTMCAAQPQQLLAQDGVPPYTWEKIGGDAPVELSSSGVLTQDATARPGEYTVVVRVIDALGATAVNSYTLLILSSPKPPLAAYPV